MNLANTNENLCRICLKDDVYFEWIEAIFEFSGPSYKECYYQYTGLQEEDGDPYSQMLCLDCANNLRNTYQLVKRALDSDKKLKERKIYINSDDLFKEYESTGEQKVQIFLKDDEAQFSGKEKLVMPTDNKTVNTKLENEVSSANTSLFDEKSFPKSVSDCHKISIARQKGQLLMCMYCSKIFNAPIFLRRHERTHEKRERTEICSSCGLKFFDRVSLKSHMIIHLENRERKYKCEFCIKSFFNRGALNIHRRIHLGQMVKCQLCTKEFYRQVDLDRHMLSHNITPVTITKAKSRPTTKQLIDCKTCGKKITWKYWESHKAKHLNQPLLQCSICSKEYYTRISMGRHLKQIHDLTAGPYEKFIVKLNQKYKPRYSSLMKQQNITIV